MMYQSDLEALFPVNRLNAPVFDFVKQIDKVYRGLGIPTLYGTLSILANKSVFFIGDSGTGKTRIVRTVPPIEGTYVRNCDAITMDELNQYCRKLSGELGYVDGKHLVFNIPEFSTLTKYHRENFLTVCSRLITDGEYRHTTSHFKHLDFRNCKLSMLIAIQPNLYSVLCQEDQWQSMSYDRFSKFLVLNPLRIDTIDESLIPTICGKINQQVIYNEEDVNLEPLIAIYNRQVSDGRVKTYAKDYAIAMAKFLGAESVRQHHIDLFCNLFQPYLDSFSILQKREDLNSPLRVSIGSLRLLGEISKFKDYLEKSKVAKHWHASERSIERHAKDLVEAELIEKPAPHAGRYRLSESLRQHFFWYEGILF